MNKYNDGQHMCLNQTKSKNTTHYLYLSANDYCNGPVIDFAKYYYYNVDWIHRQQINKLGKKPQQQIFKSGIVNCPYALEYTENVSQKMFRVHEPISDSNRINPVIYETNVVEILFENIISLRFILLFVFCFVHLIIEMAKSQIVLE